MFFYDFYNLCCNNFYLNIISNNNHSSSYGEEENSQCVLPPTPIPRLLDAATDMLHVGLINHMQVCFMKLLMIIFLSIILLDPFYDYIGLRRRCSRTSKCIEYDR